MGCDSQFDDPGRQGSRVRKKEGLTQLGQKVGIAESPEQAVLETFPTPNGVGEAVIRFSCPEFTSLCPITGQPDFARFYIEYIPDRKCVESKSLKLFMASFRNHGAFHEAVTTYVFMRLKDVMEPRWMRISGIWFPRGGIPIDVFVQTGPPPSWAYVPHLKLYPYDGR